MSENLSIFTRYPRAGATKTRLIPVLGDRGAANVQRVLTERTVAVGRSLAAARGLALEVWITGGSMAEFRDWLGVDLVFRDQGRGDLGARLSRALECLAVSQGRAVVIGADCPALNETILSSAFDRLKDQDLVLGPASDGGYYLLGLSRPAPQLFQGQPWGKPDLLARTLATARTLGLSFDVLQELADVDRPEDLVHLSDHSHPQ